jgi:hypothetical protein
MQPKQILLTDSFRKRFKKLRRHFSEADLIDNICDFIVRGPRRGESVLTSVRFGDVTIVIVKCRIRVRQAIGRYLLGIIEEQEYLPIFLDLKTGVYGKNLSFTASHQVVSMLQKTLEDVLTDYLEHSEDTPKLTRHFID